MYGEEEEIVVGEVGVDAGSLWVGSFRDNLGIAPNAHAAWKAFWDLADDPARQRGAGPVSEPLGRGFGYAVRTGNRCYLLTLTVRGSTLTGLQLTLNED